jgi:hypothetical protein
MFGQKIDDLTFALVPPLEADDGGVALKEAGGHGADILVG